MRNAIPKACLFLSGFAGLAYEVCWIRRSALAFGSTTLATSTVVAVFFLGLALGNEAFGRWSRRLARPMRWYAALEVLAAGFAVASPFLFGAADGAYGAAYRAFGDGSWALAAIRGLLVAAILLPPTIAMGAALPLVCAHGAASGPRAAGAAGVLYAINTLGAAAGCAVAGLALVPAAGLSRTLAAGALAALAAAALAASLPPPPRAEAGAEARASRGAAARPAAARGMARPVAAALFFCAGFAALAHEILWTRFLGLILRNTSDTYTMSLTVVLAGIVLGSLIASRLARPGRAARAFGAAQVLAGLSMLAIMLLPRTTWLAIGPGLGAVFALLLPPAVLSGASFPLALGSIEPGGAGIGRDVGRLTAINIAGGILGSLWAGFAGLPRLGLETSVLVTSGLCVATGVAAWWLASGGRVRLRGALAAAASIVLWLAIPRGLATRIPQDFLADDGVLVDFREGRTSNVAVLRGTDALTLEIDRWWQGQDLRSHQIMAAHVPMLLHPGPRRVLVVGAGTGQTASRFLLYPIERLDVVDIEPAVFDLVRAHFPHGWMDDPRTRALREDGRNFVAHGEGRYDVISLEVGQLFRPGVSSFYTAEFYASARARLAPDGIVCQFVPLPFLDLAQFRGIVATFLTAFPNAVLWYNTSELLLIGGAGDAPSIHVARLRSLAADAAIRSDLRYSPWGGPAEWLERPEAMLAGFLCGSGALRALSAGAATDRDDRPALEYATSRAGESELRELASAGEIAARLEPVAAVMDSAPDPPAATRIAALRDRNLADLRASALIRRAGVLPDAASAERDTLLEQAVEWNPRSVLAHRLIGDARLKAGRLPEARARYDSALAIDPEDPGTLRGLGAWYLVQGRFEDARPFYRRLLELRPGDAEAHNNYGVIVASGGDLPAAADHFREALRLRPDFADAMRNLERASAPPAERR